MGILKRKKAEGTLLSIHDGRSGSFRDWASSYDGTPSGDVTFSGGGFFFNYNTGTTRISTGSDIIGTSAMTVVLCLKAGSNGNFRRIFQNGDTNDNTALYLDTSNVRYRFSSSSAATTASSANGSLIYQEKQCVAVSRNAAGNATNMYIDGLLSGGADQDSGTPVADGTSLIIGNRNNNNVPFDGTIYWIVFFSEVLSLSEINQVQAEMEAITWPTKTISKKRQEFPWPSNLDDADMENVGVTKWTAGNNATLTKQSGKRTNGNGDQILRIAYNGTNNPYATQTAKAITGQPYRIHGWARGDGTANPRFAQASGASIWDGTSSTSWQEFDVDTVATGNTFILYALTTGTGYTEWDDVQVYGAETSRVPELWHSDWGATESVANVTAGFLENTPFRVVSGSWKIVLTNIDGHECKAIKCVSSGVLYIPYSDLGYNSSQAAYGTCDFWVNHANNSTTEIIFSASVPLSSSNASQNGYEYVIGSGETMLLRRITAGAYSNRFISNETLTYGEWTRLKITRDIANSFSMYMDNQLLTAATGSNPTTDSTHTTAEYIVLDLDTNDMIALSDPTGNHSFVKNLNVV